MSEPKPSGSQQTMVQVDGDRCSLCEFCAKHCPNGALRVQKTAHELRLFFIPDSCPGCFQEPSCATVCPEQAIRLVPGPEETGPPEILLVAGDLVTCENCRETFAPLKKIERLAEKGQTGHDINRELCPLCRRQQLVVRFIEERRAPGSRAEYKSTTEILRRAGYHDLTKGQRR